MGPCTALDGEIKCWRKKKRDKEVSCEKVSWKRGEERRGEERGEDPPSSKEHQMVWMRIHSGVTFIHMHVKCRAGASSFEVGRLCTFVCIESPFPPFCRYIYIR